MKFSKEKKINNNNKHFKNNFQIWIQKSVKSLVADSNPTLSRQFPANQLPSSDKHLQNIWLSNNMTLPISCQILDWSKHMTFGFLDSPNHTTTHTARGKKRSTTSGTLSLSHLLSSHTENYTHIKDTFSSSYARRIAYPCTDIYKPDSSTSFIKKNKKKKK